MRLEWLPEAGQDLVDIRQYIDTVTYLSDHLEIGRTGRIPGTRELVIPSLPYIVSYRVKGAAIVILGVLHTAQEWPKAL